MIRVRRANPVSYVKYSDHTIHQRPKCLAMFAVRRRVLKAGEIAIGAHKQLSGGAEEAQETVPGLEQVGAVGHGRRDSAGGR